MEYFERFLSWLFFNNRGNDDLMFTKGPAFKDVPEPTINVTSPDGGENNTYLKLEHTQDGEDRHPVLEWELPDGLTADPASESGNKTRVFEYLVVCEDADLPLPRYFAQVCHGYSPYPSSMSLALRPEERAREKERGRMKAQR